RRTLDSLWIVDSAAEHLIAAAQTEHAAAAAKMGNDIDVEARVTQRREIGDGRLRTGQDDEVGVARQRCARLHFDEIDRRLRIERVEIVEICDMRQQRNGNLDARIWLRWTLGRERERIFGRQQPRVGEKWNEAERLPAGRLGDQ